MGIYSSPGMLFASGSLFNKDNLMPMHFCWLLSVLFVNTQDVVKGLEEPVNREITFRHQYRNCPLAKTTQFWLPRFQLVVIGQVINHSRGMNKNNVPGQDILLGLDDPKVSVVLDCDRPLHKTAKITRVHLPRNDAR